MRYNDTGHKEDPSWSMGLVRGLPKTCSPALGLRVLIALPCGEPSPTLPTNTQKKCTPFFAIPEIVRVHVQSCIYGAAGEDRRARA